MEVLEGIAKSPYDKRSYRYLKLPNGLRALLVSDGITEKASAALSVRIGSLSDPDDIPGLAHFCEHMLFLGTEKYPSENEYTEYVAHNGGTFNACTSAEFTTFFFDVGCDYLRGALDRFAQFFICPLFNADAKDREVNAVESENEKNMQVDAWRFQQVCKATCKQNHPYSKFASGNKYTLETRPQKENIEVREELLKFHSTYYSSNIMCLVVIGKESLDDLSKLVQELFSPIVNKDIQVPSFPTPPYSENELQIWLEYVPVKDVRQLRLEFPLPDLSEYYDCDPAAYVAHLIGHEGSGSLLSYLRNKGWCNLLEAGPTSGAKGFMFFCVNVDLTEDGEDHVEDIVTAVFQYLAMMREEDPKEWIFKECASLDEIDFRFRDKQRPISYSRYLTHCLHEYPPCDLLRGGMLCHYRPDLIEMVLDKLRPCFVRIGILSQKFEGKTDLIEPWYGSSYNSRKIDPDLIELWGLVKTCPDLHLPKPNEFIPTDFSIVPPPAKVGKEVPKRPVLVKDTPLTKVWFKHDDTFHSPKANLCFKMSSPLAYKDPLCNSEMTLFVSLLVDDLKEYTYNAEMAGIEYKISNDVYGIKLRIGGYNHKQSILLSKLMNKMTQFVVDPQRFKIFKEVLDRHLRNFRAEQPHTHAMYYCNVILESCAWTREQLAEALETVTCEMLQEYVTEFFTHTHIEALLHGNISKQTCFELVEIVEEALKNGANAQPLPSPLEMHRQVCLPDTTTYTFSIKNEVHQSHCLEFYLQVGLENTRPNMLLELLSQILQEPCFNILRTKEQLGYIVVSGLKAANGVQGYRVLVQSMKESDFVEKRVEAFLTNAQEILREMTEDSFEGHKKALAVKRSEKPKKLKEEAMKYWSEILTQQYHFDRDDVEVACLMELKKEDVIDIFMDHIALGAPLRRKLTVHVYPEKQNQNQPEPESDTETNQCNSAQDETDFSLPEPMTITNISKFKSGMSLYPTVKPYIKTSL